MFADIVGFTPLSESRDPEDVRELLSRYFATARTVIERYGGTVEKFIGDAVMAVWGVPTTHEDDAERAVRAALDLVAEVHALADEIVAPGLTMRVGVMTGEVAVTLGAAGEGMVAGDAVNTASRIQGVAAPGQVWVDETTRGLAAAAVAFDDVGAHELKGKAEPVGLFVARAVVAARGGAQRVDGLEAPFIGRERELRLVKEMFHAAHEERRARCVTVVGVAGIGKSRLSWEFEKYVDGIEQMTAWHRGRCLSYGEGVAFYAFAEMIRGRLGVVEGDSPTVVAEKLDANLAHVVPDSNEREWLRPGLAAVIGLPDGEAVHSRQELFPAWRVYLERLSRPDDTVLLVVEDMQWADEGLVAFIEHLLEAANFPIFILALMRPEFLDANPTWTTHRRVTPVYLEPLGNEQLSKLVDGLVEGLPNDVRAALVERAEGIPLYAVETVRALIDRDAVIPRNGRYVLADDAAQRVDLSELAAPPSLHALIAARLDALPSDEKRVIQDASVLGHSFTPDGLRALIAATGGSVDIEKALAGLTRKEFFRIEADQYSPERGLYRFVQGLVRTVAYESLTKRDRKSRHLVAAGFYSSAPEADELPAVTASHFVAAYESAPQDPDAPELAAKARSLLERAGKRAESVGSMGEAERHYVAALGLTSDTADVARLAEGAARCANGAARFVEALDYADRAEAAYRECAQDIDAARVVAIAGEALLAHGDLSAASARMRLAIDAIQGMPGSEEAELRLAHMLAAAERGAGRLPEATAYYERAISLAEATSNWPRLVRLLNAYGGQLMTTGRPAMGIAVMRGALDLARRQDLRGLVVVPLANLAALQMYRDLPEARAAAREGMAAARHLGDRGTELLLVANLSVILWLDGGWDEVQSLNDELSAAGLSTGTIEWGRTAIVALVLGARGRISELDITGLAASGEELAARAFSCLVDAIRADGEGRFDDAAKYAIEGTDLIHKTVLIDDDFPTFWPIAVEYALRAGRVDEAERLLGLVVEAPQGLVAAFLRAQLPRMRALINIARGRSDGVDEDLIEAIDALRSFGAVYWTARAQLDRAEWLRSQGRADEAEPLFKEAAQVFQQLDARPWLQRAQSQSALTSA